MAYIRGKGVLVGVYAFAEVRAGKHLEAIQSAKKKTGLQHEYRDYWCDCCVPLDTRFIWSQSVTGETERRKMSNTCKWIMYKDGCSWYTECGHEQGCRIRPKQKNAIAGRQ